MLSRKKHALATFSLIVIWNPFNVCTYRVESPDTYTVYTLLVLGKILFVIVLPISRNCQSMVYWSVVTHLKSDCLLALNQHFGQFYGKNFGAFSDIGFIAFDSVWWKCKSPTQWPPLTSRERLSGTTTLHGRLENCVRKENTFHKFYRRVHNQRATYVSSI